MAKNADLGSDKSRRGGYGVNVHSSQGQAHGHGEVEGRQDYCNSFASNFSNYDHMQYGSRPGGGNSSPKFGNRDDYGGGNAKFGSGDRSKTKYFLPFQAKCELLAHPGGSLHFCPAFWAKTISERSAYVKAAKMCHLCLKKTDHKPNGGKCKWASCNNCHLDHNT